MIENLKEIQINDLQREVAELKNQGYRLVTMSSCDNRNDTFDVFYHFDKNYETVNLKITVTKEDVIPSITNLYFCAFLVENEIKELYAINFKDIVIDFGGRMYMTGALEDGPMSYGANITIERRDIGYED